MRTGLTHVSLDPAAPLTGRKAQIRLMPGKAQTAWEAVIATTFAPGERVLVIGTGPIPTLWADIADRAGLAVEVMTVVVEAGLARHLGADRFGAIKAVFVAHAGPSTDLDPATVRRALDHSFHDALLLVDASAAADADLRACFADIVVTDPEAGLARLAPRHPIAAE